MVDLDIRSLGRVLLLVWLAQPSLGKADLAADLSLAGFVPGTQEPMCTKALYVTKIVNGKLQVGIAGANTRVFGREGTLRFAGKSVRYEAQDNGEFGGKLEAILPSGERRLILEGNVQELLPVGSDLFVFEGLAHLSMTTGSLYRLANYDKDPKVLREPITFLPDTPIFVNHQTSALGGPEFWIVGTHSLVSIRPDQYALEIHSLNEFGLGVVTSFLQDQRGILIGTCGGVIAIERRCLWSRSNSCSARFYVPSR